MLSPALFFFLKISLATWVFFWLYTNTRIICSISVKMSLQFVRHCIKSYKLLWKCGHFNNINFFWSIDTKCFHLFVSSVSLISVLLVSFQCTFFLYMHSGGISSFSLLEQYIDPQFSYSEILMEMIGCCWLNFWSNDMEPLPLLKSVFSVCFYL